MNKKVGVLLVVTICLFIGGLLLNLDGKDAVSVAAQKKDSLIAADQIVVSFQQIGGRVTEIHVQDGQPVKTGTVLMQLDLRDMELQIEKTKVQILGIEAQIKQVTGSLGNQDIERQKHILSLSEATLGNIHKNYERAKALYDSGACSQTALEEIELKVVTAENTVKQNQELLKKYQSTLEAAKFNVEVLEQQKKALELQLEVLNDQKDRLTLKAPADGIIMRVIPKVGENVTANAPVLLLQTNELYFDLYVPEMQVKNFQVGGRVSFRVISQDKINSGTVRFINSAPQYTSTRMSRDNSQGDLSTFQIRIYLEDGDGLLPGMTVEVNTDVAD